jgi:hypothetical protein
MQKHGLVKLRRNETKLELAIDCFKLHDLYHKHEVQRVSSTLLSKANAGQVLPEIPAATPRNINAYVHPLMNGTETWQRRT